MNDLFFITEFGPSRFARFAGGCTAEKAIWKKSYDNKVAAIQRDSPDLSLSEVRHKAALDFRPQYRSDIVSMENERSNMETYEATKFVWDDQKGVRYTSGGYDTGIEDFHENQKRLTPEEYSLEDHLTSKAINEAFRNGATTVVTSYYREGQDHRDILIMRLDPVTKEGTTTVINTATDGNFHTFDGIMDIAKQQFVSLNELNLGTKTALLVDKEIPLERLSRPLFEVQEQYHIWKIQQEHHSVRDFYKETSVRPFPKDGMREPSFTKKRFDELTKSSPKGEHVLPKYPYQMKEIHMKPKKEYSFKMIPSHEKQSQEVFPTLSNVYTSMQEKQKALFFIKKTNVGIGSSFLFVRVLAKEPRIVPTKKEKKSSISFQERKKLQKEKKKMQERKASAPSKREKKQQRLFFSVEPVPKQQKEHTVVLFREKMIPRKEKKQKKRKEKTFHREAVKKLLKEKKGKENKLREQFGKVTRMILRREWNLEHLWPQKEQRSYKEKRKYGSFLEKKKAEYQVYILRFVQHMVFLHLLTSETQCTNVFHKKGVIEKKEQKKDGVETVWVLLSIIWYMTMIREQGLIQYQPQKKKQKKKKVKKKQGVIFDSRMPYVHAQSFAVML